MSLCAPTRFTKIDPLSRDPFFATIQQQDPSLSLLKSRLASLRGVPGPDYVFLGVGSDEVIDLVMRVTCRPGKDKILVCPPTYGMYGVTAQVNDVDVVKVDLDTEEGRFGLRVDEVRPFLSFCSSLIGLFSIYPTSLLSLLGQQNALLRPDHQARLPLLARQPDRNAHPHRRHRCRPRECRLQGSRRRRRGLHRFRWTGEGALCDDARGKIRQCRRLADLEQRVWTRWDPVRLRLSLLSLSCFL
jgi:hypothetical protein